MFKLILLSILSMSPSLYGAVRISNVNDFNFGLWNGFGDLQATDGLCAYSDTRALYNIRIRGSGAASAFTVTNGSSTIPFTVQFAGSTNNTFRNMPTGTRRRFRRAHRTSNTCNGSTNAQIRVSFIEADLRAVPGGTYTGSITIIMQP